MEPIHPMMVTIENAKRRFTTARGSRATTRRPRLSRMAQRAKVPIRRRSTSIQTNVAAGLSDDERRDAAAKAMPIEQDISNADGTSAVGNIVEIASGIRTILINGRGGDLMIEREAGAGCLESSGSGYWLSDHRFDRGDRHRIYMGAESPFESIRIADVIVGQ